MTKTPAKPKPTETPNQVLIAHYNSQTKAYNLAVEAMPIKKRPETGFQVELSLTIESVNRKELIALVRRQNHRLKRHIKARSLELLYEKVRETDKMSDGLELSDKKAPLVLKDGKYTIGHTYQHILSILRDEFPEASTSVACLRWYVVHEREEAIDQGLPWPDLPHFRPRSSSIVK
jgi:hypothetical protein